MFEIIKSALMWLIGGAQIKFILATIIFGIFSFLTVQVTDQLAPYVNTTSLSNAFNALPPSVWYFADAINIAGGATIILGAYIARFIVRRIPFIG